MNRFLIVLMAVLTATTSLSGCYGKMALTRKVYRVNGEVKDKYLRSLVSWVFIIVPVYGISALADFVLFNTIEFWSGRNPIAQGEKDFQYAQDGEQYRVHAAKSGDQLRYTIARFSGTSLVDTLTIDWNVKDGASTASLARDGRVVHYRAVVENGAVRVATTAPAGMMQAALAK